MTATLPDTVDMPDLKTAVPCECPGESHQPDGCQREVRYRASSPCGHIVELLCQPCLDMLLEFVRKGCPGCEGALSCPQCQQSIKSMTVQPV